MRVIARSTLTKFIGSLKGHRDQLAVKTSLGAWYYEVMAAKWNSSADVKRTYANASIVDADRVVFNIKGNGYRLVVGVDYLRQAVFIKWIGNHREYDQIDVRTVRYDDKAY